MSWNDMKKAKEESSMFVKLKDGQSIIGTFVGEPYCFYQIFGEKEEHEKYIEGSSFRFKIGFIVKNAETGDLHGKILQAGSLVRNAILDVKEEYGLDSWFKFKRTGSGKSDTTYSVLYQEKLTAEDKEKIKTIKIPSLKKKDEIPF